MTGNWQRQHFNTDAQQMAEADVYHIFWIKKKHKEQTFEEKSSWKPMNLQIKAAACSRLTKSPIPSGCGCMFDCDTL